MLSCLLLSMAALLVGALIGTVGVGGILLIPALGLFAGLSTHMSMATALLSFVFTGLLGTWLYQRHGSIDWRITIPICVGSLLFGGLGAMVNGYVSARFLNLLLGIIILFAGFYALFPARKGLSAAGIAAGGRRFWLLWGIGGLVGFGSGLTGVGGPVLSVPLMVILGFSPLTSIATGQVIQIAAALSGSIGNAANGVIDYGTAAWVGCLELAGVAAGARLAHAISMNLLKKIVSIVCILVGALILARALGA